MFRPALVIAMGFLSAAILFSRHANGQEEPHSHERVIHGSHGEATHDEIDRAMEAGEEFTVEPQSENFLIWIIGALGWRYTFLLPASALLSFALTAVLVIAGKGRTTGAALVFVVAMPFLIGLFGMFDGLMASFAVIARSTAVIKPSVYAQGISMSIVTPLVGMFLMVPSYLLATAGLTVRALKNDPKP